MNLWQNLEIAFSALFANKLRSALTMLGIIIGVASVVSLISIGESVRQAISDQIEGAGANVISIIPSSNFGPAAGSDSLTLDDVDALERSVDNIAAIAPQYTRAGQATYEDKSILLQIVTSTADYNRVVTVTMELGEFFDESDVENASRVIVIDANAAEDLFDQLNPVGRTLRINGVSFEVIGVSEPQGGGFGSASFAYMPITTGYRRLFGNSTAGGTENPVSSISVSVNFPENIDQVREDMRIVMLDRYRVGPNEESPFRFFSQDQLLAIIGDVTAILTAFLAAIAAISLVVGGIGIMNISLVSVTERTREIGLRKAVGAKYYHIMTQFLIETMVLSTLGGLTGIVISALAAFLVNQTGLFTVILTPESVLLGVGFSTLVGIFFGIYPASRAARLHPIEALRYE